MPVERVALVENKKVAAAAVRELLADPPAGLRHSIRDNANVLSVELTGNQELTVNFDRSPEVLSNDLSIKALALTLTEFATVSQVYIRVNGQPISGPIVRPVLNADNPQGLDESFSSGNRFLLLYFPLNDAHYVRITRIVEPTASVARRTVEELLAGPGSYGSVLSRPIPAATTLNDIDVNDGRATVDLSADFTTAANPEAALDTLVLSLTSITDGKGAHPIAEVEVLIDGEKLAAYWGAEYDRYFRP